MSINICLNLHVVILKKIFMQFLWSLLFNSDILPATSFMKTSEKSLLFLFIFYSAIISFLPLSLSGTKSSIIDYTFFQEILKGSSVVLFTFSAAHLHIMNCFCSQCVLPFQFYCIICCLSVCNIFPNLSKLGTDKKYMPSKTYINEFYKYLGCICTSLLTYMPLAGPVLIPSHWHLPIILNCM